MVVMVREEPVNYRVVPGDDVPTMKVCRKTAFLFYFPCFDPCSGFWPTVTMLTDVLFHFSGLIWHMLKYFTDDVSYHGQIN